MFKLEVDEEITLRLIEEKDATALFQLTDQSRDQLREWLPWLDGTKSETDSLAYIQMSLTAYQEKRGINLGIFYNEELAGVAGFNSIDWQNRIAYIGYWLGTEFQGYGIVTRAVRGLTEYAFTDMGINRIDIRAAVENVKSRAVPERLEFKKEGLIRQGEWLYDHYVNHAVYGMLKADWHEGEF